MEISFSRRNSRKNVIFDFPYIKSQKKTTLETEKPFSNANKQLRTKYKHKVWKKTKQNNV